MSSAALAQKANPYFFTEEDQALYDSTLNVSGTGIMGYIDIPEINSWGRTRLKRSTS